MSFAWQSRGLLFRIVVPFTLLFASVTLAAWGASVLLIGHFFDAGLRQQLARVAQGVSQSAFLFNPVILNKVKGIVDAEIVLSDGGGRVLSSTIDSRAPLNDTISEAISNNTGRYLESKRHEVSVSGQVYRGVFLDVTPSEGNRAYLSLWQSTKASEDFKHSIAVITAIVALLGIFALAGAGYVIARSITTPLVQLARITEAISAGDYRSRATIGGRDEIAQLGQSFNIMIDRLQESERKLIEAGKLAAAGQLAAGVAHEIKNPLTAIKMFVQVMQRRMRDDPKNFETLRVVLDEINRLDRIVEQIVQRARPEDGLKLELTRPAEVIEEVMQVSRDSLRGAHISVNMVIASDVPMVALDREKMKQVLWNIIVNAKDAMPRGGELTMTLRHSPTPAGGMIEMIFDDSGTGLADGVQPEACFASFFTTKPEGLGLGLTMSRKIVARHQGSLTLIPREEGGMRVVVMLPCLTAEHPHRGGRGIEPMVG